METVTHNGMILALVQQPYLDGTHEAPVYRAHAKGADDNDYIVTWQVKDGWQSTEDESDCCDWSEYSVRPA